MVRNVHSWNIPRILSSHLYSVSNCLDFVYKCDFFDLQLSGAWRLLTCRSAAAPMPFVFYTTAAGFVKRACVCSNIFHFTMRNQWQLCKDRTATERQLNGSWAEGGWVIAEPSISSTSSRAACQASVPHHDIQCHYMIVRWICQSGYRFHLKSKCCSDGNWLAKQPSRQ